MEGKGRGMLTYDELMHLSSAALEFILCCLLKCLYMARTCFTTMGFYELDNYKLQGLLNSIEAPKLNKNASG